MHEKNELTVGAFQGHFLENRDERIRKIITVLQEADNKSVDIVCFPECFLTGYYEDRQAAWESSISLESSEFSHLCDAFSQFKTTIVIGLNERHGDTLFNTAVVVEGGKCLGRYRKSYLYIEKNYCSPGTEYPVFQKNGVNFGVIICLDSQYLEPAKILALKGAQLILCPMFNRVAKDHPMAPNTQPYLSHFAARSFENHAWLVAADILWDHDGESLCPGFSRIYDNNGMEVKRGQPNKEELITHAIPLSSFSPRKTKRIQGDPALFAILAKEYYRTQRH